MNLEPIVSIALALHQHPGRYALLLGSGISHSAQIPTGWGITLDLIQQLADAQGERAVCSPDPEAWYRSKMDENPDYSKILSQLATTEHERQSLLRRYFEPASDEDREQGMRVPTPAHHAIARLAKMGTVKVVLTLNFDRLLEDAMVAEGLHPNVVSSDADAEGMVPLNHGELTIIKLHGDYRDTRLRNTSDELNSYPEALQRLLDEVLERYGLIVCGWSADWDAGLRDSIRRMTRHRYQTYWMTRGELTECAKSVITHRDATVATISGADDAFENLTEKVISLDSGRESDPLTPMMALQAAKRFVPEPRFDIQFHDLLLAEAGRVRAGAAPDKLPWYHGSESENVYRRMVQQTKTMEALTARLVPIAATGVYHGDIRHDYHWPRVLVMLAEPYNHSGTFQQPFKCLSRYPAVLCLYAIGICAIARNRYDLLRAVLWDTKFSDDGYKVPDHLCVHLSAPDVLYHQHAQALLWNSDEAWKKKPKKKTPGSIYLYDAVWPMLQPILLDQSIYNECFHRFEVALGLCTAVIGDYISYGQFYWKSDALKPVGSRDDPGPLARSMTSSGFFDGESEKLFDGFDRILKEHSHW